MYKIGVMLESFRQPLAESIQTAASLGVDGIQLYATGGETHFSKLTGPALKEFQARLRDTGQEVAAVCGDFGGHGFQHAEENPQRVENTKQIIDLAIELNSRVVTTHIGVVPADLSHSRAEIMAAACRELASYAHRRQVTLAIETGPESAATLRAFLEHLEVDGGIGVNFDPANLVMVMKEDIPAAVQTLAPWIVHTHAKDGKNLRPVDPEILYGVFAGGLKPEGFHIGDHILETPLGEGDVPFPSYLEALYATGFTDGYLTIEREVGDQPVEDITAAVYFLKQIQED